MSVHLRKRVIEWVSERIGGPPGGVTVVIWNVERVLPDQQSGPVRYPDLRGNVALVACDGPHVHVLHLDTIDFHGSDGRPRPNGVFLDELLEGRYEARVVAHEAAGVPTGTDGDSPTIDCNKLLETNGKTFKGPLEMDEFDTVAEIPALLGRPGSLTPSNVAAALIEGEHERGMAALELETANRKFHARVAKELDLLPLKQAKEIYEHIRKGSEAVKGHFAADLRKRIEKATKISPRLARRFGVAAVCCALAGVVLAVLDSSVTMLLLLVPAFVSLVVALILGEMVGKYRWQNEELALLRGGPLPEEPGETTGGSRPLPDLGVALGVFAIALLARPLLLDWQEERDRTGVSSETRRTIECVSFQAPDAWRPMSAAALSEARQAIEKGSADMVRRYEGSSRDRPSVVEVDGYTLPAEAGHFVAHKIRLPAAIESFDDELWSPLSDKLAWGRRQGIYLEVLRQERNTRDSAEVIHVALSHPQGLESIQQIAWFASRPEEVITAQLMYKPRLLDGGRSAAQRFMESLRYVAASNASGSSPR